MATADDLARAIDGGLSDTVPTNTMWVVVAAVLVLFMQAGFAMLEIGFSRMKNAGTGVAKIFTNLSIAAICYWAVGFAFAFGSADVLGISGSIIGSNGFFLQLSGGLDPDLGAASRLPVMSVSDATVEAKWLFQFAFCAVSLAIVWGSTLERIKFAAYVIYAVVFASLIYPIGSHWVFGGGWLRRRRQPPACRTSPARRRCTSSARPEHWRRCCCSARVRASTAPTANRGPFPGTPCRSSAWA